MDWAGMPCRRKFLRNPHRIFEVLFQVRTAHLALAHGCHDIVLFFCIFQPELVVGFVRHIPLDKVAFFHVVYALLYFVKALLQVRELAGTRFVAKAEYLYMGTPNAFNRATISSFFIPATFHLKAFLRCSPTLLITMVRAPFILMASYPIGGAKHPIPCSNFSFDPALVACLR